MYRIVGAALLVIGCTLIGRIKNTSDKRTIFLIAEFIKGINIMICELEFRRTPLPMLCNIASGRTSGLISEYFSLLSKVLENNIVSNVKSCSDSVIGNFSNMPQDVEQLLDLMGESLGELGTDGQVEQLCYVRTSAENALEDIQNQFKTYGRSNQTLWVCAGIGLAVILI